MAESSNTRSGENRPPTCRSVTPRNLNLNLGTPRGEDGNHEEEENHMEQQNLGVGGGGTPSLGNFFTPHVGSTAGIHTHITIPAHVYNHMMDNQARMQTWITEMMAKDQTRYRTPSPPPAMNQEHMEEDENIPITHKELAHLLKGKGELTAHLGDKSTIWVSYLGKSIPQGKPPRRAFTWYAKEHIISKLLIGRVFTWYAKLRANGINTWKKMVMEFCNKFLEEEPSMHIMDLEIVKQRQGEGLVAFIKRYRDQALLHVDTLREPQLVYGCIRNVEDGSQIYLSMSNINTFYEFLKRASDITEAMKRSGRRSRETPCFEVCAADDRSRRRSYSRSSYSRSSNRKSPPPLLPLSRAQAMVVVNRWFEDETLKSKTDREPPTAEDLRDPK
ncbi:hypothetical protein PIB30_091973 [Stylosanthes scabra]|uniref:Retrotransposon gag domain-containing protein n=1 Tax=Stylosanthes scabra TaxID=79078 RepID=A0ABU6ZU32_9FABA|nr:hypothetical protein [Stylosanthes scabra]